MKKCAVCEAEIGSDLEEFGDPREPVCARCWLEGRDGLETGDGRRETVDGRNMGKAIENMIALPLREVG